MPRKSTGEYPEDWPEIAKRVKAEAGWCCIRCDHPHEVASGYVLTVHHLDLNPANNEWWNLAALCQRCHLTIQAKVVMEQPYMFEHSDWFKPYVAGYYASFLGLPDDRQFVMDHLEELAGMFSGIGPSPAASVLSAVLNLAAIDEFSKAFFERHGVDKNDLD